MEVITDLNMTGTDYKNDSCDMFIHVLRKEGFCIFDPILVIAV